MVVWLLLKTQRVMHISPEWAFNGIGDMFSGKAYQIKTNEAYTLIYLSNNQDY